MENRARNESAFNELVSEIEKKIPTRLVCMMSNLRDCYRNTNPFYLFSDKFHRLLLKFTEGLRKNKKFNVRKCVEELTQELTFYKIACPMKHLRLADCNVPNLITSLVNDPLPVSDHGELSPEKESTKKIDRPTCNGATRKKSDDVAEDSDEVPKNGTLPSSKSESDIAGTEKTLQEALSNIPDGESVIINIKKREPFCDDNGDVISTKKNLSVTSKRKIAEVVSLSEGEISRKKTSTGQKTVKYWNPENVGGQSLNSHNSLGDTIFILDDDEDDKKIGKSGDDGDVVIVENLGIDRINGTRSDQPPRRFSEPLKTSASKVPSNTQRNSINGRSDVVDDDVFIVDMEEIHSKEEHLSRKRKDFAIHSWNSREDNDDLIIVDHGRHGGIDKTVAKCPGPNIEDDNDVCIISYTHS